MLNCKSHLCILDVDTLLVITFANLFSHSVGYLLFCWWFPLLCSSFWVFKKNYLVWVFIATLRIFFVVAGKLLDAACMHDLVPWSGMEPMHPKMKVQSCNHWTTREFPTLLIFWSMFTGKHLFIYFCVIAFCVYFLNKIARCYFLFIKSTLRWF